MNSDLQNEPLVWSPPVEKEVLNTIDNTKPAIPTLKYN